MQVSDYKDRALEGLHAAWSHELALERTNCLMNDQEEAKYGSTEAFGRMVRQVKRGPGTVIEAPLTVYFYSKWSDDVLHRCSETARMFELPAGTTLRREQFGVRELVVVRTPDGASLTLQVDKSKDGPIKLSSHRGFVPPSGRGAGFRVRGSSGGAMDKGSNS